MKWMNPWLLFRFVLIHYWLSEKDSKCLGTTTTSGESLTAAQENKIMLTQRYLWSEQRHWDTGHLVLPLIHTGSAPTAPARAEDASLCAELQCSAAALPQPCWTAGVEKRVHDKRGRNPVPWVTCALGEITICSPNSSSLRVCWSVRRYLHD